MSRRIVLPRIDPRTANDLLKALRAMAPHYTPEWPAKDDDDPGVALLKIFSFFAEGVINRLNRAPERNFLAFLDMLGIRLLPATSARVPITFLVAQGTADKFPIPKGAQVVAPPGEGQTDPIPFETIEEISVIPATLTSLIAVEPVKDAIYKPPPGFLSLKLAASPLPTLKTLAFSAAESKFLQLDLPGQVQPGDFLHLVLPSDQAATPAGCSAASENESGDQGYVVVAEVKGGIVTLTEPLDRDYPEGVTVQKLTQFELFVGKNFQAHVLYLGHSQYFDIKDEARFELLVKHAPGTTGNLQPLKIAWEFFGEQDKVTDWHPLRVEKDGTDGLSQDGGLILIKPPGEIKETEINGNKSRWIRARLLGAIPAAPTPKLPTIDSIAFAITSKAAGIQADQAFHNDTPLTLKPKFFPFGTEPRLFDRFYIGSAEAFSKPGAEMLMDFTLDATDLLAAPAAVFQGGKARTFAHGAAGRLLEFQIDPAAQDPVLHLINHRTPPETRIVAGSIPAVVTDINDVQVGVFVKAVQNANAGDLRIYLRFLPSNVAASQQWIDLNTAPGELMFNPAAALERDSGMWPVFIVADRFIYMKRVIPQIPNLPTGWNSLNNPQPAASTPFAFRMTIGPTNPIWVVITDTAGHTWYFDSASWRDVTPKDAAGEILTEFLAKQPGGDDKPFTPHPQALAYTDGQPQAHIFLINENDELVLFNTEGKDPKNLGAPPNVKLDSNPCVASSTEGVRIFVRGADNRVRGADNRLWETGMAGGQWVPRLNPSEVNLASDPFAITYQLNPQSQGDFVSVLSTSDKNALLEFRTQGNDGTLQAGPREILLLDSPLDSAKEYFAHIIDGPGKGAVLKVISSLSDGRFAVLDGLLPAVATEDTEYELLEQQGEEKFQDVGPDKKVELQAGTKAKKDDYLFSKRQLRRIVARSGTSATLDDDWDDPPEKDDTYVVLRPPSSSEHAREGSARRAVLAPGASQDDDFYNSQYFEITSGTGASPGAKQIVKYVGKTRSVALDDDFTQPPVKGSFYRITTLNLPEGWLVYRDPDQTELRPELSWEYWNGKGWVALTIKEDSTEKFLVPGKISFTQPDDIAKTEVAGQENYWIRARIVGGDYGRELFSIDKNNKLIVNKDPIRPPVIRDLSIAYKMEQEQPPEFLLTFNNLTYLDQTAANRTPDKHYPPYLALPVEQRALFFGFDKEFQGGPVRTYFAAKELMVDDRDKPKLEWKFTVDNDWKPLSVEDRTDALTKPEFVTWIVPVGFQRRQFFGDELYWIRAALAEGDYGAELPLLSGVFLNTVEAIQARTILNEILGSSVGVRNERFQFAQRPVLPGEVLRVRETLTQQERDQLIAAEGEDVVLEILDLQGRVLETWVRWKEVEEFFDSDGLSRHYRLDRATGELEFGDGAHGRIPPVGGDNIQVFSYQTGGGARGNVAAGAVNSLVTAVAGVESVINPVSAGGGSETATVEQMLEIGPAQISNRGRAVTPEDFEGLAREASREVRKVICLPNRNEAGRGEVGWVTVHIAPDSKEAQPEPSLELRRGVQRYLAERAEATLVAQDHIVVDKPLYAPVSVKVTINAKSFDLAGKAEANARESLDRFLHPLNGGPANEGWDFGRGLAASDLYELLEDLEEVDHVVSLKLLRGETETGEFVEVDPHALLASGTHEITIQVVNGE